LFFPKARISRFPFDIRNKKWIKIGENLTCGVGCRLETHPDKTKEITPLLIIGKNVQLNDYVHIAAMGKVVIGDNVLMASKIFISDLNHGNYSNTNQDSPLIPPYQRNLSAAPVIIEDNVWLGEFVTVLSGVTIGKGTIVGANSLVSKNLPPNVIAVGSPAKPIKKFNFDTNIWEKI
jgi:lipopolysaccharide O-acetyltransferase